jgi:hypothetical protein
VNCLHLGNGGQAGDPDAEEERDSSLNDVKTAQDGNTIVEGSRVRLSAGFVSYKYPPIMLCCESQ